MNFKVAKCDIEDSSPQVILCPEDCAALGLKIGDRVKVKGKTEWVTLYGSSPSIAKKGEARMPQAFLDKHGVAVGDIVEIEHCPKSEAVRFIRTGRSSQNPRSTRSYRTYWTESSVTSRSPHGSRRST